MDKQEEREQKLSGHLKELGTSAKTITKKLEAMHVIGDVLDGSNCPVANYLKKRGWKGPEVHGSGEVRALTKAGIIVQVTAPRQIRTFIDNFDGGKYPKLESRSEVPID